MSTRILVGDCLDVLKTLDDGSVQCCVTSPPYWGLRDYGHGEQLGLEATPEEYVANMVEVFREVRRVLREDGTLWLNLGDSYAGSRCGNPGGSGSSDGGVGRGDAPAFDRLGAGLKPKDLVGIPWAVAKALQAPYYAGRIKDERDRVWLAAMLDAEGCFYIHRRKAGQHAGGGYVRKSDSFSPGIEVSNTSRAIVDRCIEVVGRGSISTQSKGRNQTLYRWHIRSQEARDLIAEVYPHLVGKRHEARIAHGCPTSGDNAAAAHAALKAIHGGSASDVDFDAPASLFEQGWYLRQDIIWRKPNPMPESVRDRCTKAHEYVFLLTKSARYHYDADAVAEDAVCGANGSSQVRPSAPKGSFAGKTEAMASTGQNAFRAVVDTRNRRSVWSITTKPYSEAHFATFPPELPEVCILAGCPEGGTVLDPFGGAGTTGLVASRLKRNAILIELNPEYAKLAERRIYGDAPLFSDVEVAS